MCCNPAHADSEAEGGFTLIELLLALAILAMIATMVAMSFSSTFRLVEHAQEEDRLVHRARTCLSMIADELANSRLHPDFPWIGRNEQPDGRPADVLALMATATSRDTPAPHTDAIRIVYTRDGDRLVRWAMPNAYSISTNALVRSELASHVEGFNLRYFDGTRGEWMDAWDGQGRHAWPRAVMIELRVTTRRNESRTYTQWVSLPPQSR
jgi:general secretion pathway protein J